MSGLVGNSQRHVLSCRGSYPIRQCYICKYIRMHVVMKVTSDIDIDIYWPKVLTDLSGWSRFFRKLEILRKLKRTILKQVIIHLSKLVKFIFRKSHDVTFLASDWKVPYQNMRLQF